MNSINNRAFLFLRHWSITSISIRCRGRGRGCEVDMNKFQQKFEKQFTKMQAHKHGIQVMFPTCGVNKSEEVTIMIKKKKPNRMVIDNERNISLAATIFPYVCDIVYSGELSEEFTNLKISLSRLEIAKNFSTLRIYWYSASDDNVEPNKEMESTLNRLSGILRDALALTSVLPTIPPVVFVFDKPEQERRRMLAILATLDSNSDEKEVEISNPELNEKSDAPTKELSPWMKKRIAAANRNDPNLVKVE